MIRGAGVHPPGVRGRPCSPGGRGGPQWSQDIRHPGEQELCGHGGPGTLRSHQVIQDIPVQHGARYTLQILLHSVTQVTEYKTTQTTFI